MNQYNRGFCIVGECREGKNFEGGYDNVEGEGFFDPVMKRYTVY